MIRHGRYHDERMAEDHDEKYYVPPRETGAWAKLLGFLVVLFGLVLVASMFSPNARW